MISLYLRIALLLAEEHCQENRVLFGVQDSRLDMLLLIPRYSWLAGPYDLMAILPSRQSAPLPNSIGLMELYGFGIRLESRLSSESAI